jgi:TolB protein
MGTPALRSVLVPIAVTSVAALTVSAAPGESRAVSSASAGPGGLIAFTRTVNGHSDIYTVRQDGRRRRRITHSPHQANSSGDDQPSWSPRGRRLAFVATRNRGLKSVQALYTIRTDGTARRRLTSWTEDFLVGPAWSPGGKRIAVTRIGIGRDGTAREGIATSVIDTVASQGGKLRRLGSGPTADSSPSWSPDGKQLAFETGGPGRRPGGIWLMNADGSNPRPLGVDGGEPGWSPDGRRIVFSSARDHNGETCFDECGPNREIYVARRDGSHQRRLTHSRGDDFSPEWSPDGRRIAWVSTRLPLHERNVNNDTRYQLFVMRPDGSCPTRLFADRQWDTDPAWRAARAGGRHRRLRCPNRA